MIGARYWDCTNDDLDLYNSSNSALAAYSHVDGNQRQSEGAARCSNSAARERSHIKSAAEGVSKY